MNREDVYVIMFLVVIPFSVGLTVGILATNAQVDYLNKNIEKLELELKHEREYSELVAEENRFYRKTISDLRHKLWLNDECVNGTLKAYISELERMNDDCLTVNTLILFYGNDPSINKTELYWLDPLAEQHKELLKKWGFEVR
jgi:hypothetical protein